MNTPDRDLLVGLLAAQQGWLTGEQLLEAVRKWVENGDESLQSQIAAAGLGSEEFELLDRLLACHQKNDPELQHISDFFSSNSLPVEEVASICEGSIRFPSVERSIALFRHDSSKLPLPPSQLRSSTSTERFRILKQHAQGGLGVVYVAQDNEFSREVAIKQIRSDRADIPRYREKFEFEASITGSLEHPGIVPIYALGSDEAGRPFYAMRFIKGESLEDASVNFHANNPASDDKRFEGTTFRELIRRLIDVCDAVQYAHDRGVLHRDLKPGNIMLGKYGETLVVDWGLAKDMTSPAIALVDDAETSPPDKQDSKTEYGTFQGTSSYAPPEQLLGKLELICPATDVYSLGSILHELLLGCPPAEPKGSASEIASRIEQRSASDWPDLANTPLPLAHICRIALKYDSDERYPTAALLRDDLQRWLDDEPISGMREAWQARLSRWCRKNPSRATGGAVGMALAALLLLVTAGFSQRLAYQTNESLKIKVELNNKLEVAIKDIEERNHQLLLSSAGLARSRGNHREAAERLLELDALQALTADNKLMLAKDLWFMQELDRPRNMIEELLATQQTDEILAQLQLVQGDLNTLVDHPDGGLDLVQTAVDSGHLPPADLAYAQGLLAKTPADAVKAFDACLTMDPFHPHAAVKRGLTRLLIGEIAAARKESEQYAILFPDDLRFHLLIGMAAAIERDDEKRNRVTEKLRKMGAMEDDIATLEAFSNLMHALDGAVGSTGKWDLWKSVLNFLALSNAFTNRQGRAYSLHLPKEGWIGEMFQSFPTTLLGWVALSVSPKISLEQLQSIRELAPQHQLINFTIGFLQFSEGKNPESFKTLMQAARCDRFVDEFHRLSVWTAASAWAYDVMFNKRQHDFQERQELANLILQRRAEDGRFISDPLSPVGAFGLMVLLEHDGAALEIAMEQIDNASDDEKANWQKRIDQVKKWQEMRPAHYGLFSQEVELSAEEP